MIQVKDLYKTFKNGSIETPVLKGVSLTISAGEWVAIMGRSGAGKSTLMYQMSLLDEPTSGDVIIDGHSTKAMTTNEETDFRLHELGYVFQDYALVPDLTAIENVVIPLLMQGKTMRAARNEAAEALTRVGIAHRLDNVPSALSGGEQQRVSVARAIAHKPKILFADEPTANLDRESSGRVMDIFKELHDGGQTIVMVTHEEEYGTLAGRIIRLDDGKVVGEVKEK